MDLGSEISQKFKASIKRKLKECGTYIDDELPEYIMVMIANKRKNHQMKDDLSLFLGDETDNFVYWLFQMLGKLQNVTEDKEQDRDLDGSDKLKSKETKPKAQLSIPKKQIKSEEKSKEEREAEDVQDKQSNKEKEPSKGKPDLDRQDKIVNQKYVDPASAEAEREAPLRADFENSFPEHSGDKSGQDDRGLASKNSSLTFSNEKLKNENIGKDSQKRRKSSSSLLIEEEKNVSLDYEHTTAESLSSSATLQKIRPSLPKSRQATGLLIKKAIKEANQSVTIHPRNQSTSSDQVEVETSQIETVVDRRVHLKRGRSKLTGITPSSVIANEAPEFEVEAEESETTEKKKRPQDAEKSQEDGIEVQVDENEFLDEEKEPRPKSSKRIVIASKGFAYERDREKMRRNGLEEKLRDQMNEGDGVIVNKSDENEQGKDETDENRRREKRRKRHKRDRSGHREKRKCSPKFVVTLHGALDSRVKEYKKRRHDTSNENFDDPLFINLHPKKPMEILESAQKEIDKMAHQLDVMQNVLPKPKTNPYGSFLSDSLSTTPLTGVITSVTRPVYQETLPLISRQSNERLIPSSIYPPVQAITGVLPLTSPVLLMQNAQLVNKNKPVHMPSVCEVVVPLDEDKDEDMSEDDEGIDNTEPVHGEETDTVLERCKFWPNCKNSSCLYIHPSRNCRMFPNCSYKEKCMFIHPMCKFNDRCSNPTCSYAHSLNQNRFASVPPRASYYGTSMDAKIPICKFVPNCTRADCTFRHPIFKPCRYGSGCKRANCQFNHETRPAKGDALKWSSTSHTSQKHISERQFAAPNDDVAPVTITMQ